MPIEIPNKKETGIICGTETEEIKCKIICPNCGSKRDCSDP
ncbi:MAG: hypothetical protein AABW50_03860 [Nanoarchaeota archaeon]